MCAGAQDRAEGVVLLLQFQDEISGVWKPFDLTFILGQLSLVPGLLSPTEVGGVNWKAADHLEQEHHKFCTKSTHDFTICSLAPHGTQSSNKPSIMGCSQKFLITLGQV